MTSKTLAFLAVIVTSSFTANIHADSAPLTPQTEFEQLAVIFAKYSNHPPHPASPLCSAILEQDHLAIDMLLKYGANLNPNCLEYAVEAGSIELVQKFIAMGIDPNEECYSEGGSLLLIAIQKNQNEIARYLIDIGLRLNNDHGHDYLQECLHRQNYDIYNLLLEKELKAK